MVDRPRLKLCERCRRVISEATRRGQQKSGNRGGRPRLEISVENLMRVRARQMSAERLAEILGCSVMTVRRRLRELYR